MSRNEKNWQKVRLEEICSIFQERIDDPKQAKTKYYVGLEHLDSNEPKILRHGNSNDVVSSKFIFKKGQILFGRRRAYLRKLAIAEFDGICSTDIFVLDSIPGKIVDGFLSLFLQSEIFFERVLKFSAGSLSPRVKWKQISKEEFVIPSKSEQKSLVSFFHQIDDTILKTKDILEKFKIFQELQINELTTKGIKKIKPKPVKDFLGNEIEIPESWDYIPIKNIVKLFHNGIWGDDCKNDETDIPVLRSTEINHDGTLHFSNIAYRSILPKKIEKYTLQQDDLLIVASSGSKKLIGRVALFNSFENRILFSNFLLRLRPKNITTKYLYYFLNSKLYKDFLEHMQLTSTGLRNFPKNDFLELKFPLPNPDEQELIISKLDLISTKITLSEEYLSKLKNLKKVLLYSKLIPSLKENELIVQ